MNTSEVEDQMLLEHLFRHIHKRHIRTYWIAVLISRPVLGRLCGDAGAITHEGVFDIGIDGGAIALCLPIARHRNPAPLAHVVILTIEVSRT